MYILQNVPLSGYSTMRLGGPAAHLTEVNNRNDVVESLAWAESQQLPVIMIGGGSNIIWPDSGFPGLVLVNKIMRYEAFNEDEENMYVTAGAGEVWDRVVEQTVLAGYSGLETLSLIPGTAGAAPIQNIGAYGGEISQVLVSVEAYDRQAKQFINIPSIDCGFGYRTSRFKTADKGRYFISALTLHVTKTNPMPPFYESLQTYLSSRGIHEYTPQIVRDAVIAIRSSKLPDPAVVANNGSFFTNPIVTKDDLDLLQLNHPDITYWPMDDGRIKISAAWLLEQAGFKGMHDSETGMAIWDKHALVLVNEHAASTANLLKFRQKILDRVQALFGIALQQEPELIGV